MGEKVETTDMIKQQAMLMLGIGLILAIIGVLEFEVPGMPFRGSGIGTICLFAGALLLAVGYVRLNSKAKK